jgi:hypothetical protein
MSKHLQVFEFPRASHRYLHGMTRDEGLHSVSASLAASAPKRPPTRYDPEREDTICSGASEAYPQALEMPM